VTKVLQQLFQLEKQDQLHILSVILTLKFKEKFLAILDAALDEADRFDADTQITATLIAAGTTATTGQVSVTFTYVQANNLSDATAV
jgi:hypothetical protein